MPILAFLGQHLEPLSLLKKTVKLVFALLAATLLFGGFLLFTAQGNKIALMLISELTPFEVKFSSLKGTLYNQVVFNDFELKGPQLIVQAKRLELGFEINQLFKNDKTLQTLHANELMVWYNNKSIALPTHYDQNTLTQAQADLKKSIPFVFNIEQISIDGAFIHWNHIEHTLTEFKIKHASSNLASIEEIHYAGAYGSLDAYLKDAIKVNWNLHIAKNPYLMFLQTYPISTKGNIVLPTKNIDDPDNQFDISLNAKEFKKDNHHFQNVQIEVKGTPAKHQVHVNGVYNHAQVKSVLLGGFTPKTWNGDITTLKVDHHRWEKIGNSTGKLAVDWHNNTINTALDLLLSELYPVSVQADIHKKHPFALSGNVKTHIKQIKTLSSLVPSVANLRGELDVDINLAGSLIKPEWLGYMHLKNAKLPATSLGKKAILNDLRLTFLQDNKVSLNGKGLWGSGEFTITGGGQMLTQKPNFNIQLKGEKLLLSDTPEYYIVANPDLSLTLQNGNMNLTGQIVIPEADIKSLKSPEMVSASDDVVVISKKPQPKKAPALIEQGFGSHITTHVELILKDKITYKGHGVSSKVGGRLEINQQPGQPPLAKGKLFLTNGTYKGYGKVFDISYGQILFTGGPIYDPILDIRAQRTIEPQSTLASFKSNQAILAGVTFSGYLKSPKIGFYSNPSMPDSDIISYLIVGRPQSQINEAQAELLFQAVSQIANVMGGNRKDVQFNLAEKLKLDQLGFSKKQNYIPTPGSHNPLEDTVFVLGKQLSSRLYLNYSVGLVDSASQFGMRYALGKNVTIEAATGTQGSSADVLLSFEGH